MCSGEDNGGAWLVAVPVLKTVCASAPCDALPSSSLCLAREAPAHCPAAGALSGAQQAAHRASPHVCWQGRVHWLA